MIHAQTAAAPAAPNGKRQPLAPLQKMWLTPQEAGAVMGFGKTKTYGLIMSGKLRSVKSGKSRRIPLAAIDELAEALACGDQL